MMASCPCADSVLFAGIPPALFTRTLRLGLEAKNESAKSSTYSPGSGGMGEEQTSHAREVGGRDQTPRGVQEDMREAPRNFRASRLSNQELDTCLLWYSVFTTTVSEANFDSAFSRGICPLRLADRFNPKLPAASIAARFTVCCSDSSPQG